MDLYQSTQNLCNSNLIKSSLNFRLCTGDFSNSFLQLIKEFCPMGKVAFVCLQKSFNEYGVVLNQLLLQSGGSLVTLVLDGEKTNTVEGVSKLFTLPEDVRLVFYLDPSLCQCVSYFSHVRNIPLVYLFKNVLPSDLFSSKALIKNGNKLDQYKINPLKIVVLDRESVYFNQDLPSKIYAYNVSKLTALYDYRIDSALSIKKELRQAYSLARQAVLDTFNVFSCKQTEILDKLIYSHFSLNIANGLTKGDLFSCSSAQISARLYGAKSFWEDACKKDTCKEGAYKKDACQEDVFQTEFVAFFKVATLYSKFLAFDGFIPAFADHIKNATDLSQITGLDFSYFIGCYTSQNKRYKGKIKVASDVLSTIEKEVTPLVKLLPKIKSTYFALKGQDVFAKVNLEKLKQAIKYSGDCTAFINGTSLLREKGITYLID